MSPTSPREVFRPLLRWPTVVGGAAVLGAAAALWVSRRERFVWDSFCEVKAGVLYRSGQLSRSQLDAAIRRYGLRTVVNLCDQGLDFEPERQLCQGRGVRFISLPMPGSGLGKPEQFRRWLAIAGHPDARPVLVHCAAGSHRTGAAIALYRLKYDGWLESDVVAEMRRHGYRPGGQREDLVEHVLAIWRAQEGEARLTAAGPRT